MPATLITFLILAAITIIAVRSHMKAHAARAASLSPQRTCPRCGAPVPGDAAACPACRVPLSAYEVVAAAAVSGQPGVTAGDAKRLHALVRADVCVGCGTCVAACPEPGAILMADKRAIVDLARCVGHGKCAQACPVGAIVMTTGEAVQRIEVPDLDTHFESNIPGLYIVGELGGRGLIKNAVNEGAIAVEHIAQRLGGASGAGPVGTLDVLVVGSGPAGLSAGLTAQRAGLRYLVLERGGIAESIRRYPRHKILLAEPVKMPLYGDLWIADTNKESLLKVWEAIVASTGLKVSTGSEVKDIGREGALFQVKSGDQTLVARTVVLAMGRRGSPRRLGIPGEESSKVLYDIMEMEAFAGRRVLVVGGGDSAIESAVGLSKQPGTQVTLSYRGESFSRLAPRNTAKINEAVGSGRVKLLLSSQVRRITDGTATLETASGTMDLPNDDVIVRIGGLPPDDFLRRVGVRMVKKDLRLAAASEAAGG